MISLQCELKWGESLSSNIQEVPIDPLKYKWRQNKHQKT